MRFLRTKTIDDNDQPRRRVGLWVGSTFVVLVLVFLTWFVAAAYQAKNKIITDNDSGGSILFRKNVNDIKPTELTGENDGRVNIAIFGMGGANHPGGTLADTEIVVSIDLKNNSAVLISVPRDLYVKVPGYGFGKINTAYAYGEKTKKGNGAIVAKKTLEDTLGIPIHYYFAVDFEGFKRVVDLVGGVTVTVEKDIDDPFYPAKDMIHYAPVHFKAGTQTLNGERALQYARTRHTSSDFARAARQQQVMVAVRDKALSIGFLTNPTNISEMLKIAGDDIRTDMQLNEIQQLFKIVKDLDSSKISNKVFDTAADGPLTGTTDERGYVIVPRDGNYSYAGLKSIVHETLSNPFLVAENAKIEIRNATAKTGQGAVVSALLKTYHYNVIKVSNHDTKEQYTELIAYSNKFPFTQAFLEKRFALKARMISKPADAIADFVVIVGNDYKDQQSTTPTKSPVTTGKTENTTTN